MLDRVICLLQVQEASIEGALSEASCVNEVAQSEEVMDGGLERSEACLSRAAQLMLLRPINKPVVENDGIQPILEAHPQLWAGSWLCPGCSPSCGLGVTRAEAMQGGSDPDRKQRFKRRVRRGAKIQTF